MPNHEGRLIQLTFPDLLSSFSSLPIFLFNSPIYHHLHPLYFIFSFSRAGIVPIV